MPYTKVGNKFYSQGREGFLKGEISWINDDIRIALFNVWNDTSGTGGYDDVTQRFLADVSSSLIEFKLQEGDPTYVTHASLVGKTATDGIADADDMILYEVKTIDNTIDADRSFEAAILFKWTGDELTSPLICFVDTGVGIPFIPNDGHIKVNFSNGPNKIFRL
jgi:hypothetical protein